MTFPRRPDAQDVVGPHLGADVAALADGQLRGAARDRALGHISVCDLCRSEVEGQLGLKAELGALRMPDEPSSPLRDMLLGLGAAGFAPVPDVEPDADATRPSRTRSVVLAGVALGVIGGGLGFAMVERAGTGPAPGNPSVSPYLTASPVPGAVVMIPGGARREVPLVADLQHR